MQNGAAPRHGRRPFDPHRVRGAAGRLALGLGAALAAACGSAAANSDPFYGLLAPGNAGLGVLLRAEPSLYRGDGRREVDFTPLVRYESTLFYLQSTRAGLKLERGAWRAELFWKRRTEGFPSDDVPASMAGLGKRSVGDDFGAAMGLRLGPGTAYLELLRDVSSASEGTELRVGYRYEGWWHGRLGVRPYVTVAYRDAKLNNYYYGTPGHDPGAGTNVEVGAVASYRLTERWQLLGAVGLLRASSGLRDSPVVDDGTVPSVSLGFLYGVTPDAAPPSARGPLIVRALRGASSECILLKIVSLVCVDVHTEDPTDITAVEVGRRLAQGYNGWPVDLAAFVGLLHHDEKGLQQNAWQLNAYFKAYYYGFPWRRHVRTRLGLGLGLAYAEHVPLSEVRDQARRGRDVSKLLLYADPTLDVSVGDLFGLPRLRETFVGVGASHRSGIFGWSRVFNNVDGGSNYIYGYVETSF